MEETLARHGRRFHARLWGPACPVPSLLQLWAFRTARTTIELERDRAYYRDRGWLESDYCSPTRLGPLRRAAGAAFDRLAARAARPRSHRAAGPAP